MNDNVINKIIMILEMYKDCIPKGYRLWERRKTGKLESLAELLGFLGDIFREEEMAIEEERKKTYVTDDYENGVRRFAISLLKKLLENHEKLDGMSSYVDLLGQKHMAYAFYHLLDADSIDTHNIQDNIRYRKYLYQGLVDFYSAFYGSFADNEEAICLLCKYYPKDEKSWFRRGEVISALRAHIESAGTSNDLGYAYHGIEQIQKYIHGLTNDLIRELLRQYALYDVLYQKVYRHQIFAIIDGSGLEERDKHVLKFFYLDSLLLANLFNTVWVDKAVKDGGRREVYFNSHDEKLDIKRLQVLKNPDAYWDNENTEKRLFWEDGQQVAGVLMEDKTIVFFVQENWEDFPFIYSDWELEDFRSKEIREKIRQLVSDRETSQPEEKQMTFSLLYLNNYRGMQDRILDFDHKYTFSSDRRELKRKEEKRLSGLHFYGKAVYSLSCIVGKNGTGKTSIIDFLRETFYKIVKVLEDFNVPCENGYITTDSFQEYRILEKELKFLVVFRIGKNDYFLTNLDEIKATGLLPYQKGICRNLDFCKVAYFSQQMMADQTIFFENGERVDRQEIQSIARTLKGLGQCDYSELKSYIQKRNALATLQKRKEIISEEIEQTINKELCYQFSLLRNVKISKICGYLDILPERELVIYNLESDYILERFLLKECNDISKMRKIEEKYARMPDAGIGFVSSGQYAKLMFLAKLHWFLVGYNKDKEYYRSMFGRNFFPREEALQKEESALIFIDEGELYYHPEWQRRFLAILLDMLSLCEEEAKLQVVFTTNSPFVISDVLKEDVQYLSDKTEEFGDTLGQNIHKLLKKNFFMDYTIGEYSRGMIEAIIWWLSDEKEKCMGGKKNVYTYFDDKQNENEIYQIMRFLIQQIGEPVYREKLERMLEERIASKRTPREIRIRELERQKADLETEIAQLKGDQL